MKLKKYVLVFVFFVILALVTFVFKSSSYIAQGLCDLVIAVQSLYIYRLKSR